MKQMQVRINYFLLLLWSTLAVFCGFGLYGTVKAIMINSFTNKDDFIGAVIGSVICAVFFLFFFQKARNEKFSQLKAIYKLMPIPQVNRLLSTETFSKVNGLKDIWESEHWLAAAGQFVPKNFIVGIYDIHNRNAISRARSNTLVLINGNTITCYAKLDAKDYVKELKTYQSILPNAAIMFPDDLFKQWYYENRQQLKLTLQDYLLNHKIEELICQWSNISSYHSSYGIKELDNTPGLKGTRNNADAKRNKKQPNRLFEKRTEYITDSGFIDKFHAELKKHGEIQDLTINQYKEKQLENTFVIPLFFQIPVEYSNSFNSFLALKADSIWEQILCDDTMELLHDTLISLKKEEIPLQLLLTNDCSDFDESYILECLGIDVRY